MEQLLENNSGPKPESPVETGTPVERKCPTGHVERVLNYKDRHLILLACASAVSGTRDKKSGDYKAMVKLDKVKKLLGFEAVEEYFETIDDSVADKNAAWTRATNLYGTFEMVKTGAVSRKQFADRFPDVDFDSLLREPPKKPSLKVPQASPDEKRGKISTFYVPAKLDVFIESSLKEMSWGTGDAEYVVELAEKYELPLED